MKLKLGILLLSILLAACQPIRHTPAASGKAPKSSEQTAESKPENEVVVIEKTNSYHRDTCARVHMARTKNASLDEAAARHLKPCPYCKPGEKI